MNFVRKSLRVLVAGLFTGAFLLLSWHVHAERHQDLHKGHDACGLCSNLSRLSQKTLAPVHQNTVFAQAYSLKVIKFVSPKISRAFLSLYPSRAPPTA